MKQPLKTFFSFTRSEHYALMILLFLIVLVFLVKLYRKDKVQPPQVSWELLIDSLSMQPPDSPEEIAQTGKVLDIKPFLFDPNEMLDEEWRKLGLKEYQINNINNYLKTGAQFSSKEDFRSIYTLSEEEYRVLEPYIRISVHSSEKHKAEITEPPGKSLPEEVEIPIFIELNTSKKEDLIKIPGVGPVFAERIKKYQALLGGYQKIEQLKEVYGMKQFETDSLKRYLYVDPTSVKKISVNNASFDALRSHPYLSSYEVKSIITYRSFSPIDSLELLEFEKILPEETYLKIRPYLEK